MKEFWTLKIEKETDTTRNLLHISYKGKGCIVPYEDTAEIGDVIFMIKKLLDNYNF